MTDRDRGAEASAPNAAAVERLRGYLDERERRADERERVADERERVADERDQIADERARIADVRDFQLSQARAPRPGDIERHRQELLKRARQASDRSRARMSRLEAELARGDANRERHEAEMTYDAARSELERERGNFDGMR